MTMSMATKAEGTAAMERNAACWLSGEFCRYRNNEMRRMAQDAKEIARRRSARVSCRRLSCKKMMAMATKRTAEGMAIDIEIRCTALPIVHKPSTPAVTMAGTIQGLCWEYNWAPRKNKMEATAYSQRLRCISSGNSGTQREIAGPRK